MQTHGPTPTQKATVAAAVAAGAGFTVAKVLGAPKGVVRWFETPAMVAQFAAALAARPTTRTQQWATAALGLSALGDFFLTRPRREDDRDVLAGMASFGLAYAALAAGLARGRPTPSDAAVTAGVVAWSGGVAALLWPHVAPPMRPYVLGFSACISSMAIAAGTTPGRGWFSPTVAHQAAAASAILLASDTLVALSLFHPRWRSPSVARDLAVRLTYLAGWTLILLVVQHPAAGLRRNVGGP